MWFSTAYKTLAILYKLIQLIPQDTFFFFFYKFLNAYYILHGSYIQLLIVSINHMHASQTNLIMTLLKSILKKIKFCRMHFIHFFQSLVRCKLDPINCDLCLYSLDSWIVTIGTRPQLCQTTTPSTNSIYNMQDKDGTV